MERKAKDILDDMATLCGWTKETRLIVACEFIDRAGCISIDQFRTFLQEAADLQQEVPK